MCLLHYSINSNHEATESNKASLPEGSSPGYYQRKDKSRSLRHSKRKALPRYKVQHLISTSLICRSISVSRAEWLSTTPFHIPAPERPPKSALGVSRLSHSVQLQRCGSVCSPCLQSQQLQRTGAQLFSTQNRIPLQKAYTPHQPSRSPPNPNYTREQASTSSLRARHVAV